VSDLKLICNQRFPSNKILTIGIPTYDRLEELSRLISQIFESDLFEYIDLLVIDDGKKKLVNNYLRSHHATISQNIRVIENNGNLGYSSSFVRIFEECKTPFVLIMADDDLVVPENFQPLIKYIIENDPDFISPQFFKMGLLERGVRENRAIKVKEFRACCNHAPGLVYKISSCRPFLHDLKSRLIEGKTDVLIYPQVILIIHLLNAHKRCIWLDFPTANEGANLPSSIRDSDGSSYWEFLSRCRQLIDFEEFLLRLKPNEVRTEMLEMHRRTAYTEIIGSLTIISPGLAAAFHRSLNRQAIKAIVLRNKYFTFLYFVYKKLSHH
jgi:glycosyltransferase involved in cell wall biosynthesis